MIKCGYDLYYYKKDDSYLEEVSLERESRQQEAEAEIPPEDLIFSEVSRVQVNMKGREIDDIKMLKTTILILLWNGNQQ